MSSNEPSGRSPFDYAIRKNIFKALELLPLIVINWKILFYMLNIFSQYRARRHRRRQQTTENLARCSTTNFLNGHCEPSL